MNGDKNRARTGRCAVVRITRPVAKPGDPYQDPAGIVIITKEYMTVLVFVKEKKKVASFDHIFCAFFNLSCKYRRLHNQKNVRSEVQQCPDVGGIWWRYNLGEFLSGLPGFCEQCVKMATEYRSS